MVRVILNKASRVKMAKGHLEYLLKNIFYTGDFKFAGTVYQGKHEALISKELFNQVQQSFKKDNKPFARKEHHFAFSNLLTCGECGSSITAEIKKGKYIYYHCTHGKDKNCSQKKYTSEENLEKLFQDVVFAISLTKEEKQWILQGLKESNQDKADFQEEHIIRLEAETKKIRNRLNKLYTDKLDGIISEEFWQEHNSQWNNDLDNLLIKVKAFNKANTNFIDIAEHLLDTVVNIKKLYNTQDNFEKVKLLKILLSNCSLKDGKIDYKYKKPFDVLVKRTAMAG